jgi:hypothetical protein
MCFEFEIPNKAKYKNKNEIVEGMEIEPEPEKVEESVIVSAS